MGLLVNYRSPLPMSVERFSRAPFLVLPFCGGAPGQEASISTVNAR